MKITVAAKTWPGLAQSRAAARQPIEQAIVAIAQSDGSFTHLNGHDIPPHEVAAAEAREDSLFIVLKM